MPDQQEFLLTPQGHAELKEELAWREGEKTNEITEAISTAKAFGDLSENAEYDAARDEQARNEDRIAEINYILNHARVVDTTDISSVSLGCKVTVREGEGEPVVFEIVGTTQTDSRARKISNESPLGAALIGRSVGETVEVATPSGALREYTVAKIER